MNCKYCHLKTHYIDKCPTIICKNCKKIGHPLWLCKEKKNDNKTSFEKKKYFSDEIKKKSITKNIIQKNIIQKNIIQKNIVMKNINNYLNMENKLWGDLVTI
jgi:hypothetical protein